MLIAFHTKHIMGALSLKASLPLRVGFIELGGGGMRKEGRSWEVCSNTEEAPRLEPASLAGPLAATVEVSATQGPRPIPQR